MGMLWPVHGTGRRPRTPQQESGEGGGVVDCGSSTQPRPGQVRTTCQVDEPGALSDLGRVWGGILLLQVKGSGQKEPPSRM